MRSLTDMRRLAWTMAVVAWALAAPPAMAQRGAQEVRAVQVAAIPGVVAAGAAWTVAWQGTDNADGLVGAADGGLLFAQEQPRRISKLDAMDRVSVVLSETRGVGSIGLDANGRLLGVERTCTDPGGRPDECREATCRERADARARGACRPFRRQAARSPQRSGGRRARGLSTSPSAARIPSMREERDQSRRTTSAPTASC